MWFLIWLQIINNNVTHYELGQFESGNSCAMAKKDAAVLITNSNTVTYCFEVKESK